jgi:hypothetical protein
VLETRIDPIPGNLSSSRMILKTMYISSINENLAVIVPCGIRTSCNYLILGIINAK